MTKTINRLKKILLLKINRHSEHELGQDKMQTEIFYVPKQPSKAVIEIARRFNDEDKNTQNLCKNDTLCPNVRVSNDDLYIRFENFILENSEGEKLPSNYDIETYLGIGERKRKELIKVAREKGVIIRKNATCSILNLNYD